MRLVTFDGDRVGVVSGTTVHELTGTVPEARGVSAMRALIHAWSAGGPIVVPPDAPQHELADLTLAAPLPDPPKIVAAPVNYRDHQAEMNEDVQVGGLGFFLKAPSSITGPGSVVHLPYTDRRFDHEGELAVIIGRTARTVGVETALEHVFGYTNLLDLTMRGGEDRSVRKSFETFTPIGPWIVTADEFGRPDDAELSCWVNGVRRQHATTRDLIWGVARFISYASSVTTLLPGDVLATGTPAGVGPIVDGDLVEVLVEQVGAPLSVTVSAAGAGRSPTTGHGKGPVPPPAPGPS